MGPAWLSDRIAEGEVVIIDGATGTALQARGVPMIEKGWSVLAQLEYPEILQGLHEDYLRAGAKVIIANTFAAGRHMLEPAGLGDRVADAHVRAVQIAQRARDSVGVDAVVAGSVSSYMADVEDPAWIARLDDTYREQVELLAEAGAEVIALEMMEHPRLSAPAVAAALESGLPVWLGVSARRSGGRLLTSYSGEDVDLETTVRDLVDESIGAVFVMHTPVDDVSPALEQVAKHWDGPVGAYPEAGHYEEPIWHFDDPVSPERLVELAGTWVDQGARLLGGCCGFEPDHIAALTTGFLRPGRADRSAL